MNSRLLRRISQTFFFLFFIYILWSTTYPLTSFLPPEAFFKTNPLLMLTTAISERTMLHGIEFAILMLGVTLLMGRFFCGWACPLGAMSDLVRSFKKGRKSLSDKTNAKVRKTKYFILAVIAIAALFGFQFAWVLDPIVIMGRFVSLSLIPAVTLSIDKAFITAIQASNYYAPLYDLYRGLKNSLLGVQAHYFASSLPSFLIVAVISAAGYFLTRLWCRVLCPLGAVYGVTSKPALFGRQVSDVCIKCGQCQSFCRVGAIKEDVSYVKSECVMCMDCAADCPVHAVRFTFETKKESGGSLTRKDFLMIVISALVSFGFSKRKDWKGGKKSSAKVLRPPAALPEKKFQDRCVRCGNCMKVCPTNGLQPAVWESGTGGVWTPQLVPEIGYCEYNCNLCGQVCPTGAIHRLPLAEKQKARIGLAQVHRSICLAWHDEKQCIVCEEHCPVPSKAIKLIQDDEDGKIIYKPYVDKELCIGCGICQTKCPARPVRAIRVYPL